MIFQILDDKKDCRGVYADGKIIYDEIPKAADFTWSYSDHLRDRHIQYAHLWVGGKSLKDACPEHLRARLDLRERKIKGHFKSFRIAKVNLNAVCFFDLVPSRDLLHYFEVKNQICEWIFNNHDKPENYSFFRIFFSDILIIF